MRACSSGRVTCCCSPLTIRFVDVDLDVAMDRVFLRQVAIGIRPETSLRRIAANDRPNGELVNTSKVDAQVLVPSEIPFSSRWDAR